MTPRACSVVEGAITVARAIGSDSGDMLTVSVKDDQTSSYFSVPVSVGRAGVLSRHTLGIAPGELEACRQRPLSSRECRE
jgi:malate/lactate dehydrogenase